MTQPPAEQAAQLRPRPRARRPLPTRGHHVARSLLPALCFQQSVLASGLSPEAPEPSLLSNVPSGRPLSCPGYCLPRLLHVGVRDPSPGFPRRRAGWREAWGTGGQGRGRLLGHHTARHREEATRRVGRGKAPLTPSRARWTPGSQRSAPSPGPGQSSQGTSAP